MNQFWKILEKNSTFIKCWLDIQFNSIMFTENSLLLNNFQLLIGDETLVVFNVSRSCLVIIITLRICNPALLVRKSRNSKIRKNASPNSSWWGDSLDARWGIGVDQLGKTKHSEEHSNESQRNSDRKKLDLVKKLLGVKLCRRTYELTESTSRRKIATQPWIQNQMKTPNDQSNSWLACVSIHGSSYINPCTMQS